MAIFSRKQPNKDEQKTESKSVKASAGKSAKAVLPRDLSNILAKPRITEKAVAKSEAGVYTFVVKREATKRDVRDAVKAIYNVTPVKVNIVNKQPRKTFSRMKGRTVSEKGLKKAYVYLKAGDTISLV